MPSASSSLPKIAFCCIQLLSFPQPCDAAAPLVLLRKSSLSRGIEIPLRALRGRRVHVGVCAELAAAAGSSGSRGMYFGQSGGAWLKSTRCLGRGGGRCRKQGSACSGPVRSTSREKEHEDFREEFKELQPEQRARGNAQRWARMQSGSWGPQALGASAPVPVGVSRRSSVERELRISDVVGSLRKAASSCQGLMGVAVSSLARLSFNFSLNKVSCDRSKRQLGASEHSTSSWFACGFARPWFVPVAFPWLQHRLWLRGEHRAS